MSSNSRNFHNTNEDRNLNRDDQTMQEDEEIKRMVEGLGKSSYRKRYEQQYEDAIVECLKKENLSAISGIINQKFATLNNHYSYIKDYLERLVYMYADLTDRETAINSLRRFYEGEHKEPNLWTDYVFIIVFMGFFFGCQLGFLTLLNSREEEEEEAALIYPSYFSFIFVNMIIFPDYKTAIKNQVISENKLLSLMSWIVCSMKVFLSFFLLPLVEYIFYIISQQRERLYNIVNILLTFVINLGISSYQCFMSFIQILIVTVKGFH
ncbi:uncharacterized protein NDAI_0C01310 [Naumovozyma dairenensis CBS 421]|uniref:Uncharacterized protein n=1 Tax=Naumovozyma dairenensis (strain ATCC 10597 / BCRC 20456 / CBS 421 / NBRC 0211 / NRRL Y-12639) TaxID=1071378 RepID=G0W7N1_NAUDC|nr:hypothetical protein NDAI_0C01310 [Naumovozyma dairenensis CBS 421]CCD23792.1 hypothetical protein NDAI_0C01310 [Naumovozyma dairenensis CBS 421]